MLIMKIASAKMAIIRMDLKMVESLYFSAMFKNFSMRLMFWLSCFIVVWVMPLGD